LLGIARNGQGSTLRTAHQFAEPTAAITGLGNASGAPLVICGGGGGGGPVALPSGFTLPPGTPQAAATAIMWALGQLGTPYSFGGDCTNPHGGDPAHQCDCSSLVILSPVALAGLGPALSRQGRCRRRSSRGLGGRTLVEQIVIKT